MSPRGRFAVRSEQVLVGRKRGHPAFRAALVVVDEATGTFEAVVAAGEAEERIFLASNPGLQVLDVGRKLVVPGLLEVGFHFFGNKGQSGEVAHDEVVNGTLAAAAGGITTLIDTPPDALPPALSVYSVARRIAGLRSAPLAINVGVLARVDVSVGVDAHAIRQLVASGTFGVVTHLRAVAHGSGSGTAGGGRLGGLVGALANAKGILVIELSKVGRQLSCAHWARSTAHPEPAPLGSAGVEPRAPLAGQRPRLTSVGKPASRGPRVARADKENSPEQLALSRDGGPPHSNSCGSSPKTEDLSDSDGSEKGLHDDHDDDDDDVEISRALEQLDLHLPTTISNHPASWSSSRDTMRHLVSKRTRRKPFGSTNAAGDADQDALGRDLLELRRRYMNESLKAMFSAQRLKEPEAQVVPPRSTAAQLEASSTLERSSRLRRGSTSEDESGSRPGAEIRAALFNPSSLGALEWGSMPLLAAGERRSRSVHSCGPLASGHLRQLHNAPLAASHVSPSSSSVSSASSMLRPRRRSSSVSLRSWRLDRDETCSEGGLSASTHFGAFSQQRARPTGDAMHGSELSPFVMDDVFSGAAEEDFWGSPQQDGRLAPSQGRQEPQTVGGSAAGDGPSESDNGEDAEESSWRVVKRTDSTLSSSSDGCIRSRGGSDSIGRAGRLGPRRSSAFSSPVGVGSQRDTASSTRERGGAQFSPSSPGTLVGAHQVVRRRNASSDQLSLAAFARTHRPSTSAGNLDSLLAPVHRRAGAGFAPALASPESASVVGPGLQRLPGVASATSRRSRLSGRLMMQSGAAPDHPAAGSFAESLRCLRLNDRRGPIVLDARSGHRAPVRGQSSMGSQELAAGTLGAVVLQLEQAGASCCQTHFVFGGRSAEDVVELQDLVEDKLYGRSPVLLDRVSTACRQFAAVEQTLATVVRDCKVRGEPLEDALDAMTRARAQILNLSHCKGSISVGMDADFVILDADSDEPRVESTFCAGQRVILRSGPEGDLCCTAARPGTFLDSYRADPTTG